MLILQPGAQTKLPETPPPETLSREQRIALVEANMCWFNAEKERLAKEHPDCKYAAVCWGMLVGIGNDSLELVMEFYRIFGNKPVFIGKLSGPMDVTYVAHTLS